MRRRRALHLLAAASLPLAGCSALSGSSESTPTTDASTATATRSLSPTPTATPNGTYDVGESVTVEGVGEIALDSVAVQRSVIDHHTWRELREPADSQVLLLRVSGVDPDEESLAFAPRFDGEVVDGEMLPLYGRSQTVALAVPVRRVESVAVVLQATERPAWELPTATRDRLAAAPEFHLHDAAVRETSGVTELELTVENRGGRSGTFRGVVVSAHIHDADDAVRFDVPAGETVTRTVRNSVVGNWAPDEDFEHDVTPSTRWFAVGHP